MSYELVNPYTNIEYSSNKNKLESAQEIWDTFSKNTKNYVSESYFTLQKGGKFNHFIVNETLNEDKKISYTIKEFKGNVNTTFLKDKLKKQEGGKRHKYSKKSSFSSNSTTSSMSNSSDTSSSSGSSLSSLSLNSSSSSSSSSNSSSSNSPYLSKNKKGMVYKFKNKPTYTYTSNPNKLNTVVYYDIFGYKFILPTFKQGINVVFTNP